MTSILLCATPVIGHITPLLAVARELVGAGHRVRFLTGERYRVAVDETGAEWLPLPADADYDDRAIDTAFPGRVGLSGPAAIRYDMINIFLRPLPAQAAAVAAALEAEKTDVVLAESLFAGILPLLLRDRPDRPAVLNLGIVPLGTTSRDTAPFGLGIPPMSGPFGPLRNAMLGLMARRVIFGPVQKYAQAQVEKVTGRTFPDFFLNWPAQSDGVIQFSVEGFEYPRSDLTTPVHFVGPVSRSAPNAGELPIWWDDLDGTRPIVHVSQGTIANNDIEELLMPTIRGLAGHDVLVVASTGGRNADAIAEQLPPNARVAEFLPYDALFDKVDVFVSNGGYGGVHFALQHGVPLVVAGMTEDKVEVTARVAWSGAGINLRTNAPTDQAVAKAVETVLADGRYREASRRLGAEIAAAPGVAGVVPIVEGYARQSADSRRS